MTPWSEWSRADKRKYNKLQDDDDMDFFDYIDQKEAIEEKYNHTVHHKSQSAIMNCKHCGPYFKNRANINNWDVIFAVEHEINDDWDLHARVKQLNTAFLQVLKGTNHKLKLRAISTHSTPNPNTSK